MVEAKVVVINHRYFCWFFSVIQPILYQKINSWWSRCLFYKLARDVLFANIELSQQRANYRIFGIKCIDILRNKLDWILSPDDIFSYRIELLPEACVVNYVSGYVVVDIVLYVLFSFFSSLFFSATSLLFTFLFSIPSFSSFSLLH